MDSLGSEHIILLFVSIRPTGQARREEANVDVDQQMRDKTMVWVKDPLVQQVGDAKNMILCAVRTDAKGKKVALEPFIFYFPRTVNEKRTKLGVPFIYRNTQNPNAKKKPEWVLH